MREAMGVNLTKARGRWHSAEARAVHSALPEWLAQRVSYIDVHLYQVSLRVTVPQLDLEQYRHTPAPLQDRRNGFRGV